jgi:WD40 repeat protein
LFPNTAPGFAPAAAAAAAGGGGGAAAGQASSYSGRGYALKFSGHRNTIPSRNAAWMGNRSQYVVSGSDDGSLFVWDSHSGEVVNIVRGGAKAIKRVQVGLPGEA